MLQCAHVVQPVGQLDDDDANVLRHGQEHLAHVLRLHRLIDGDGLRLRRLFGDVLQLCRAVDEVGDLGAEAALQLLVWHAAVLLDIVQERGCDGDGVELEVRNSERRVQRVDHVRFARSAKLAGVARLGEAVRLLDQADLVIGDVAASFREEPLQPGCYVCSCCYHSDASLL